jgi:rhodanese-related sulfurtransferase
MMKFLKQNGLYLLAGILIFIYAFSKQGEKLTPRQFADKLKATTEAQLIDVRTSGEYNEGHIKKAANIDWNGDGFDDKVSKLDKNAPVFLYCRSGKRSSSAAKRMKSLGFSKIYELEGGITKWEADGMPLAGVSSR